MLGQSTAPGIPLRRDRSYGRAARGAAATRVQRFRADQSDLAFILDCTGSMQRYINSVRDHIFGICDMIRGEEGLGGPDDLRVAVSGLTAYALSFSRSSGAVLVQLC
jgi:hypothetical protein